MPPEADSRWSAPRDRLVAMFLRPVARPVGWGIVVALALLVLETLVVIALQQVAGDAFGAVFLLGVLVVSAGWGFALAIAMSLTSALVYVLFHIEDGSSSLVPALLVFLVLSFLVNVLAGQARLRAEEADQRRREAELSAELARVMLRSDVLRDALEGAACRMAQVLGLQFAVLDLDEKAGATGQWAIPLNDGGVRIGTLLIPDGLDHAGQRRVLRVVPSVEALLAAARTREEQLREAQLVIQAGHARVAALADQQAALRHVATLVAGGADPDEVYQVAVDELARGLRAEHVTLVGFENDSWGRVLAAWDRGRQSHFSVGEKLSLDGTGVAGLVRRTGHPARIDDYSEAIGPVAERLRAFGLRSGVGTPVIVDGQVRAALIIGAASLQPMPPETEPRIADFADLIATAIFNAESRAEITASRARVVAAADQARRRFERDLHDGAQQRIVSLGLELRAVEASLDGADVELRDDLHRIVEGLGGLYTDLQELSRGLHPAVLSKGGLIPALKTLARRSHVPVRLELEVPQRLPESIEVAAYYVVAEALTNATKHAQASEVSVTATVAGANLLLSISDDGVGGATSDLNSGSGLVGLRDRVEALSGRLEVVSPVGVGTTMTVTIPTSVAVPLLTTGTPVIGPSAEVINDLGSPAIGRLR